MAHNLPCGGFRSRRTTLVLVAALVMSAFAVMGCARRGGDGVADGTGEAPAGAWVVSGSVQTVEGETSRVVATSYELDEHGGRRGMTVDNGEDAQATVEAYDLDDDGYRVAATVTAGDGEPTNVTCHIEKDDSGRIVRREQGSTVEMFSYSEEGELATYERTTTSLMTLDASGKPYQTQLSYTFDADGRTTALVQATADVVVHNEYQYELDDAGRATAASVHSWVEGDDGAPASEYDASCTYAYDEQGNLVSCAYVSPMATSTTTYEYVEVEDPTAGALLDSFLATR